VTPRRDELIRTLAEDLAPRAPLAPARAAALGWLAAALALVAALTLASGPLRPGLLAQLASERDFALDLLLLALVVAAATFAWLRLRVPGAAAGARAALPAVACVGLWLALQAGAVLLRHGQPPATLGARPGCWHQVLFFSLPPLALALFLARRAAPLERAWTGLLAGLAAGALGALAMELACMRDPLHALVAHFAPALGVALAGALLAPLVLRRI